jgi:hypothetical protein
MKDDRLGLAILLVGNELREEVAIFAVGWRSQRDSIPEIV